MVNSEVLFTGIFRDDSGVSMYPDALWWLGSLYTPDTRCRLARYLAFGDMDVPRGLRGASESGLAVDE